MLRGVIVTLFIRFIHITILASGFMIAPPGRSPQPPLHTSRVMESTQEETAKEIGRAVKPQSVLVIGSGAVGCLYGGRLSEAGHAVTFLMRRDLEAARQKGLRIDSPDGHMYFPPAALQLVGSANEFAHASGDRPADWVILSLKSTSFSQIPTLLGDRAVGPDTRVLLLMNGLGLEEDLSRLVDPQRIFGGMAFVCANRGPPGSAQVIHQKYGKVVIGHARDDPQELERARELWRGSKTHIETAPCLLKARWEKLCWNQPFNGLGVMLGGVGTRAIVGTPPLRELAGKVMKDVIRAANADLGGRDSIDDSFHDLMFQLTDVMGDYNSSTVLDLRAGLPLETHYLFSRPLARARQLGVLVPYMESVVLAVEGVTKFRGLEAAPQGE